MNRSVFRAVDPARSRIVLIGTPHYRDEHLPDVPVVAHNVADLAAVFTDPELGGFAEAHCRTVPGDADLARVGEILTDAAEQASDLLLVYYSGHGLIDRRGNLYLSLAATRPDQLAYSALTFDAVRETFLDSRAENRVLILDSCFSGRAIGRPLAGEEQSLLTALDVAGTYTLTAATANRVALALDGERHTAFTERMLRLFQDGSTGAGQMLTLNDIYRHLLARLTAEGLPVPQQRGTGTAELLGLVRNRQGVSDRQFLVHETLPVLVNAAVTGRSGPVGRASPERPSDGISAEDRAVPLIEKALRHASGARSKQLRRVCLSQIAPVVAAVVEEQALAIAATMSDEDRRQSVLADIAVVVAAADIFRAIDMLVNGMEPYRTTALAHIVRNHGLRDPRDGEYVLDTYVLDGPRPRRSTAALSEIARAVAAFAPDRAEEIAARITDERSRTDTLAAIARTVAATDPGRAFRLLPDQYAPWTAPIVAEALAFIDPDGALRLIAPLAGQQPYPTARAGVARAVAVTDPQRALHIARGITDRAWRAKALVATAQAVAATDPDRALEIIAVIGDRFVEQAALADVAPIVAADAPERAMQLAESISDTLSKVLALTGIASVHLDTRHPRSSATSLAAR
ncbi:caspase family protein (plasmid) [Streptomyces sp. NBC_01426]|uniref:caspase family protein n=1 Tax=Streptomyces sp. NBC_01426 TaxID=2975866 RepID=UPI002E37E93D|nr:caspase family protein [Streptomyces sp. NBC_01426]